MSTDCRSGGRGWPWLSRDWRRFMKWLGGYTGREETVRRDPHGHGPEAICTLTLLPSSASSASSAVNTSTSMPRRPRPGEPVLNRGGSQSVAEMASQHISLRASPSASGCVALSIWGERGRKQRVHGHCTNHRLSGFGCPLTPHDESPLRPDSEPSDRGARGGKSADQGEHAAIGRAADTEPGRHIDRVAACASGGARRFGPPPLSRHHPR